MSKWIRKGDRVKVTAGNDKGKVGEVLARGKDRVLVQGVNIRKKHMRPTQQAQGGRIVEMETPLHISNVSLCDKDGTPFKVKVSMDNGEKMLVNKKDATVYRSVKKEKNV